jgi:pyridoxamine 5'-phosphate oxidase
LSAWASRQSEVLDARRVLDARMAEMTERFADKPIPLPPNWGGYRLRPDKMEFWQGRPNRLHDRFRYTRQADGSWQIDRLAP